MSNQILIQEEKKQKQKRKFDLHDAMYCVVGNAWGGSNAYKNECEDCWSYSVRLPNNMDLAPEFWNHFNEKHT
jgi:hypothetical protein